MNNAQIMSCIVFYVFPKRILQFTVIKNHPVSEALLGPRISTDKDPLIQILVPDLYFKYAYPFYACAISVLVEKDIIGPSGVRATSGANLGRPLF